MIWNLKRSAVVYVDCILERNGMSIQTLVVTINQNDHSLVEKMNIRTDAIVGNQCGYSSVDEFEYNGNSILYLNSDERGVGKNRNAVLAHATSDICVFADDDMRFIDDYPELVTKAFSCCKKADIIIFNLIEANPRRYKNKRICRIHHWNYAKYGAARLAILRQSIIDADISFNTQFGGGCKYCAGEDTIFLKECLDKGLRLYAVPWALAEIDQCAKSTWFKGYNEKFFSDKGALFAHMYPRLWILYGIRFLILRRKKYKGEMPFSLALKHLINGGSAYASGR